MPRGVWLFDEEGLARDEFFVGESVFVTARGLTANTLLAISLDSGAEPLGLIARYMTDRHGCLPMSPLLQKVGLLDLNGRRSGVTYAQATEAIGDREFSLRLAAGEGAAAQPELRFAVRRSERRPCIYASDSDGRAVSGIEIGDRHVGVVLQNFPEGCVRVTAVRRQFGWRAGDPIEPARTHQGAPIAATVRVTRYRSQFVQLARADDMGRGSYQFIARFYRPNWYEADDERLLRDDIVSDRRFASLVIRSAFKERFGYDNGVVLTPQIAGRPLAHRPYFHFLDTFPKGTDVYAALDPDALPPGLVGTRAAIYVIRHKTAAQWAASNSLTDVSGPGMTSAVKVVPIVPGCVNWNTTLVWPNPQVPGKYDIVIDFGNNVADPAQFTSDGQLDATLDMIDGYVRVGFSVTDDPSLPGPFATIGQHDYAMATIDVPSTDTGPTPTTALPITATVRYPAQSAGIDAPVAAGAFPLVIVMHGNSGMETSYRGYDYLLSHLASWGFIAASIYAPVGAGIETRARAILAHLGVMTQENADPGLFHGHIDLSHLGIAGHSRGGEAVIRAARINIAEALGWNIQAGISIAPTDYFHYGDPGIPLLVIYGANDGDVSGAWPDRTGFDIYDEAGRPRSFAFVYGATHDRFNTEWASIEASTELTWDIEPSDIANLISVTDHQNVAKAYVAAFLRAHLLGQSEQLEYFSSALTPSLLDGLNVHLSHQLASTVLDDFNNHNPALNALGAVVAATALPTFAEDSLRALDPHSPHVVAGANVAWQTSSGIYLSNVPIASRDLSGFDTLSFRVAQKYESVQNPPGALLDFDVRLIDRNGKSRAIRVSTFADIPYPYVRADDNLVKSALKTVRIPLASYTIANLGAQDVDLTNVASISFEFDRQATGEIDIADLEFGP